MKTTKTYESGSGRITEAGKMKSAPPAGRPAATADVRARDAMSAKPAVGKPFPGAAPPFTSKDGGKARGR